MKLEHIYFKTRDGSFYKKYTKEEIYSKVNNTNPNTFLPFLKELNYPYIEDEWERCLSIRSGRVFGLYLSRMRLMAFRHYTFSDSDELNEIRKNIHKKHYSEKKEEGLCDT